MRFVIAFIRLALFALPVLALEGLLPVKRAEGEVLKDSYIILLKDVPNVARMENITGSIPGSNVTSRWSIVNGFAATLTDDDLNKLRVREDILSISENAVVRTSEKQTDAPWGLQRISHREPLPLKSNPVALNYTYIYDGSAGYGVDVYIIDTGIQIDHPAFTGRARWGATFGGYPDHDGFGHGTHCAGIVGSVPFGVSKAANLIAVKVLGDDGSGLWSDFISGVDWVAKTAALTGRPSVASVSLGGPAFDPADTAVANLVASGVPTTVSAGNGANDVKLFSPARTPSAITVAAMDINDTMASFSNYGTLVDIFAPGANVSSTWINSSTRIASGTSMAAPHVSGFVAYLLGMDSSLSVAAIEGMIDCYSTEDVLKLSRPALNANTPNKLLYNDYHERHHEHHHEHHHED